MFQIVHFDWRIFAFHILLWSITLFLSSYVPPFIGDTTRAFIALSLAVYILISTKDMVHKYKKNNGDSK